MDVKEIVEDYLKDNGFDGLSAGMVGLCSGCSIGDLMGCAVSNYTCEPAHKTLCIECQIVDCRMRKDRKYCMKITKQEDKMKCKKWEMYNSVRVNPELICCDGECPNIVNAVLVDVMAKIREQSLFVDSSTIEIDDAVLEEILSHYFA